MRENQYINNASNKKRRTVYANELEILPESQGLSFSKTVSKTSLIDARLLAPENKNVTLQ